MSQFLNVLGGGFPSPGSASFGDVDGPASATDNALVRFDGTTGKLIQNGVVTENDNTGTLNGPASQTTTTAAGIGYTNQPANDGVELVSSSALDVQTATVIGTTNGTDTTVAEAVVLTGTTPVATVKTDWGVILAIKLSSAAVGTITVREASADLAITTLAPAATSSGVATVTNTAAYNRVVQVVASGATTKQIGFGGTNSAGTQIYDSQALTGTTPAESNSSFLTLTEIYIGDLEATRTVTETAASHWRLMGGTTGELQIMSLGIALPSTQTLGLQLYNTADQTTNYERGELLWTSNRFAIRVSAGGSGTNRDLDLRNNGSFFRQNGTGTQFHFSMSEVTQLSSPSAIHLQAAATFTQTSGTNAHVSFTPTYNQASGTAANTDLLVNRTEAAIGSGAQLLMDLQLGSVSKMAVDRRGLITLSDAAGGITVNLGVIRAAALSSLGTNNVMSVMGANMANAGTMLTMASGTFSNSSGQANAVSITPTYNQTSTAAATDLLINRTQTAVGSGAQLLIDAQAGGATKFSVDNVGNVTATAASANPGIALVRTGSNAGSAFILGQSNGGLQIQANSAVALSFGSTQQATFTGSITTTPQLLSGAGAINVTTSATEYTSTGVAQALTLANGTVGQIKYIVHTVDGGSGVLTPTTAIGFTTVTFTAVGDSVSLLYTTTGWAAVGSKGALIA